MAEGKPLPRNPDAWTVDPGKIDAFVAEFSALPPAAIPAAFQSLSFDEQLALDRRLWTADSPWPPGSLACCVGPPLNTAALRVL